MSEWREVRRRFSAAVDEGDTFGAEKYLAELGQLAERFDQKWSTLFLEGLLRLRQTRYEDASRICQQAAEQVYRRRHWGRYYAMALHSASVAERLGKNPARALELLEKELVIVRARRLEKRIAYALRDMGYALIDLERHEEALARFEEADTLADVPWHKRNDAHLGAAIALMRLKRTREAMLRVARATQTGGRPLEGDAADDIGHAWRAIGHWIKSSEIGSGIVRWYLKHLDPTTTDKRHVVYRMSQEWLVLDGDPNEWRVLAHKPGQTTVTSLKYGMFIVASDIDVKAGEIVTVKLVDDRVVAVYELS